MNEPTRELICLSGRWRRRKAAARGWIISHDIGFKRLWPTTGATPDQQEQASIEKNNTRESVSV